MTAHEGNAAAKRAPGRAPAGVTAHKRCISRCSRPRQASAAVMQQSGGHVPELAAAGRGCTNPAVCNVLYTVLVSAAIWSLADSVALFRPTAMISPESGK